MVVTPRMYHSTIDRFQGSSLLTASRAQVIAVSFVVTGELKGPIFENHRRVNVARTRAKKTLVPVGNEPAPGSRSLYERVVEWAQRSCFSVHRHPLATAFYLTTVGTLYQRISTSRG